METVEFVIFGEPASKANSRQAVPRKSKGGKVFVAFIKSDKAQQYTKSAVLQIPQLHPPLTGPLAITIKIFYASNRPDLDPSLIFDLMQDRVYVNDRQLREMHIYHAIDKANPRAEISICTLSPQTKLEWPDA